MAMLAALLLFTNASALAPESHPIKVAAVFPYTGLAAVETKSDREVVVLAVEQINKAGGLLGRKIELVQIDNQSSALGSAQAAKKALEAGVVGVVGPAWSSHAMAMAPILQEGKTPMIGTSTSAPPLTAVGDYIFRACYTDVAQGQVLADFARRDMKSTKAAILHIAQDVYSEGLAKYFSERFAKHGGTIVAREAYLLDGMDFSKQIQRIAATKPDLILVPGYARDTAIIISQIRQSGLNMPILGGDGWSIVHTYPMKETRGGENYFVTHWSPGVKSHASRVFLDLVRRSGPDAMRNLSPGAVAAYDAVGLLVEAIRKAGSTDRAAVRNALAGIKGFKGATGEISFDSQRNPHKPLALMRLTPNGAQFVRMLTPE